MRIAASSQVTNLLPAFNSVFVCRANFLYAILMAGSPRFLPAVHLQNSFSTSADVAVATLNSVGVLVAPWHRRTDARLA